MRLSYLSSLCFGAVCLRRWIRGISYFFHIGVESTRWKTSSQNCEEKWGRLRIASSRSPQKGLCFRESWSPQWTRLFLLGYQEVVPFDRIKWMPSTLWWPLEGVENGSGKSIQAPTSWDACAWRERLPPLHKWSLVEGLFWLKMPHLHFDFNLDHV